MKHSNAFARLRPWVGLERNTTTHAEKWISAIGALLGIAVVWAVAHWVVPASIDSAPATLLLLTSMGASAVLLFAVPHGALSQPWAVVGGHVVSAFIGVACQKLLAEHAWAPAIAVGLSVGAMHYLRCIHPPGGATALAAVIGGPDIHALGFHYLLAPVGIEVAAILLVAVAFNGFFPWRRYPAHLHRRRIETTPVEPSQRQFELTQEDFSAAMEQLNSYVDITEENLTELLELAKAHAERQVLHPDAILPGHTYSNGRLGRAWSVRHVREATAQGGPVDYATVAGEGSGQSGRCTLDQFRQWARFEVRLQEHGRWVKA